MKESGRFKIVFQIVPTTRGRHRVGLLYISNRDLLGKYSLVHQFLPISSTSSGREDSQAGPLLRFLNARHVFRQNANRYQLRQYLAMQRPIEKTKPVRAAAYFPV